MKIVVEDRVEFVETFEYIKKMYSNVKKLELNKILRSKVKYDIYFIYCDEYTDFSEYTFDKDNKVVFLTNCIAVNHICECANLIFTKGIIYVKSEKLKEKILENILSIEWSENEENINCNNISV